jgi:hypothetical protein
MLLRKDEELPVISKESAGFRSEFDFSLKAKESKSASLESEKKSHKTAVFLHSYCSNGCCLIRLCNSYI